MHISLHSNSTELMELQHSASINCLDIDLEDKVILHFIYNVMP